MGIGIDWKLATLISIGLVILVKSGFIDNLKKLHAAEKIPAPAWANYARAYYVNPAYTYYGEY